jgi:hypothetical protein
MFDRCDLLVRDASETDPYGLPLVTWLDAGVSPCGLDIRASREMVNAEAHVYDARLRLPFGTQISNIDRVRITHRYGNLMATPLVYDLIGDVRQGPSGILVDLRSVTNA